MHSQYSKNRLWCVRKYFTVDVQVEWHVDENILQHVRRASVYTTESYRNGEARYDAARYKQGRNVHYGVLHVLYRSRICDEYIGMCLVQRLIETEPDPRNRRIVEEY